MRAGSALLLAVLLVACPATAQTSTARIVTSSGPERTAITLYRDPDRPAARAIDTENFLRGYALVSETRIIELPAGAAAIRFEGVAGGILPESAIVSGLPSGVSEKNQDADLLSPASLLDRSLGRRVRLRRTSGATGAVREEDALIRTGADGGVVLQTAAGFEALRCSGLPETLVYDALPAGLSAKPTLSVEVASVAATRATVILSYLAWGFDWQADYVATLSPDGQRMDLFAWMTLANGDQTSFRNADAQAVAGRLEREERADDEEEAEGRELRLQCWPSGRTSDLSMIEPQAYIMRRGDSDDYSSATSVGEEIIVTGSRIALKAVQEELGDLKLYRIPEPVTVAAMSRKQVAMIDKTGVPVELVYRARVSTWSGGDEPEEASRVYRARNRQDAGLGLPLPGGRVTLFTPRGGRPVLIGEGFVEDRAVGEDVEIEAGTAPGVRYRLRREEKEDDDDDDDREQRFTLVVTNDQPRPVEFEAVLQVLENRTLRPARPLTTREGRPAWRVRVPANGRATLAYALRSDPEPEEGKTIELER